MYYFVNESELKTFLQRELMTEEQVKDKYHVDEGQFRQIICRHELKPIYTESGERLYLRTEVEEQGQRLQ